MAAAAMAIALLCVEALLIDHIKQLLINVDHIQCIVG